MARTDHALTVTVVTALRAAMIALPSMADVAVMTGVGVALAASAGAGAAAAVATLAVLGSVVGSTSATWTLRWLPARAAASILLAVWSASCVLGVLLAAAQASAVLLSACAMTSTAAWVTLSVLSRQVVAGWDESWLRRLGPAGRVGAAAGALVGAAVAASGVPLVLLVAVLPVAAFSPALRAAPAGSAAPMHAWDWSTFSGNAALALTGYGPLILQVAFVAATAGPAWAGVSMVVYAAAALAAPRVAQVIPQAWHRSPAGWLMLAFAADLTWALTLVHPLAGMLVARAASAMCLFAAEGSADIAAHRAHATASALSGRSVGGVVAAALGTAMLAQGAVPAAAAAAFAALALGCAVALAAARRASGRAAAGSPPRAAWVGTSR